MDDLNPGSLKVIRAYLEPSLKEAKAEERFQFERHGYFVAGQAAAPGFTRTVTLRDSWAKS
jgi:glutaminyl-tRNA synthetase